jgi:hypothetical protein
MPVTKASQVWIADIIQDWARVALEGP